MPTPSKFKSAVIPLLSLLLVIVGVAVAVELFGLLVKLSGSL